MKTLLSTLILPFDLVKSEHALSGGGVILYGKKESGLATKSGEAMGVTGELVGRSIAVIEKQK